MGTVIGYKNDDQERFNQWHTMRMLKRGISVYKAANEHALAEGDKAAYGNYLSKYVN